MPVLRSGLVIAGGYADKVRRVLFAQLRDQLKSGEIEGREVARAAGELNRLLFEILVDRLRLDKGDVVRIIVEYEVSNGRITWKLDTLSVQAWRRMPDEEIQPAVREVIESAGEILSQAPSYDVERLGESDTGDVVYRLIYGGEEAGALLATPINGKAVVRLAVTQPRPKILKRHIIDVTGELDESIRQALPSLIGQAEDAEKRQADRVVREIMALLNVPVEEEEE